MRLTVRCAELQIQVFPLKPVFGINLSPSPRSRNQNKLQWLSQDQDYSPSPWAIWKPSEWCTSRRQSLPSRLLTLSFPATKHSICRQIVLFVDLYTDKPFYPGSISYSAGLGETSSRRQLQSTGASRICVYPCCCELLFILPSTAA